MSWVHCIHLDALYMISRLPGPASVKQCWERVLEAAPTSLLNASPLRDRLARGPKVGKMITQEPTLVRAAAQQNDRLPCTHVIDHLQ